MNKLILDTHALLWILNGDPRLSKKAKRAYENADDIWFSMVSLWEIGIKLGLHRDHFSLSPDWWREIPIAMTQQGVKRLNIEPEHCQGVSLLPHHHRDPFDRLLIAQCKQSTCSILSVDSQFDAYSIHRIW